MDDCRIRRSSRILRAHGPHSPTTTGYDLSRFRDAEVILAAANEWKERCLLQEGSLFTERPLWTRSIFDELRTLYVENLDDESSDSFLEKLRRQLEPGSPDAKCLWAEMMWIYLLIVGSGAMAPGTKRTRIREIWEWSEQSFPEGRGLLDDTVLGAGVVNVSVAYQVLAWKEYRFFVTAMLAWCSLEPGVRRERLSQPWEFASWLDGTEFSENRMFRHALLFLLFPDEFEPIVTGKAKREIAKYLHGSAGDDDPVSLDKAMLAVRRRIEGEYRDGFHFYARPVSELWQPKQAEAWFREQFGDARVWIMNVGAGRPNLWSTWLERGIATIGWGEVGDLRRGQEDIQADLTSRGHGENPSQRAFFLANFGNEVKAGDIIIAVEGQKRLMGWGEVSGDYEYDPEASWDLAHSRTVVWRPCEHPVSIPEHRSGISSKRLTEFTPYMTWVRFAFWLMDHEGYADLEEPATREFTIDQAHDDLFMPRERLERLVASLRDGKNLILQGPPGTGKTFIARRIAWCVIGYEDDEPIEMVQFHQSYAYEDFVQGFRPTEEGGFRLKDGVFHRFCERARKKPDKPHVFIIDEINRGNLSRIFGELLMLIEADKRSEKYGLALTYSDDRFHVPENVHILGMMNTADRSLALVDYALRRRFAFETLEPAYGTAEFKEYLERKSAEPDLVRRIFERMGELNEAIRTDNELGRGFEIGHSYFVPGERDKPSDAWYEHVVDTQVEPLLREYWFDSPTDVEATVARLKGDGAT